MHKIFYAIYLIRKDGLKQFFQRLFDKIMGRSCFTLWSGFSEFVCYFEGKKGLEIGGPSAFFNSNGCMPIYPLVSVLDGVNYSDKTVWTGSLNQRRGFWVNDKRAGELYILDAVNLSALSQASYDFILSCNNIEHIANPLRAIESWLKVLRENGVIVLVAPRRESNFDHRREIVDFKHLHADFVNNISEDDTTHIEEILQLHDLSRDFPAGNFKQFKKRCLENFENRCLHHHVFDLAVLLEICHFFKLEPIGSFQIPTDYVVIAKKRVLEG